MTTKHFRIIRCVAPGVEAIEAETSHTFGRHMHEHFGVGLIASGAQRSASGRGMVEAGAGDLITVNPGEVHDGAPIGEQGRRWRMLYFEPTLVAAVFDDLAQTRGALAGEFAWPVVRDARASGYFNLLYRALTDRQVSAGRLKADETLSLLLVYLLEPRHRAPRRLPPRIDRAKTLIDDDPLAPLSLARLASEAGLSRYQLVRGFARQTGLTPHAYLMQRRILLARRLIAGGMPLAQAAAASGFADQSHMTRLFVRCFGYTPGYWAKPGG